MNLVTIEPMSAVSEKTLKNIGLPKLLNMNRSNMFIPSIERLPYGLPRREKIQAPLDSYDPAVAYWLDSDDPLAMKPDGHPWSRVTYREHERNAPRARQAVRSCDNRIRAREAGYHRAYGQPAAT
jgi:hypothetical protein